jgi:hypothetical protein
MVLQSMVYAVVVSDRSLSHLTIALLARGLFALRRTLAHVILLR